MLLGFSEKKLKTTKQNGRQTVTTDNCHQCCGSGMFIHDPGSWFLSISDPRSKNSTKRGGGQKFNVLPFFVATNILEIVKNFIFEWVSKKNFTKKLGIILLFTHNFVIKLSKIWVCYTGPGSKRDRIPDPEHWLAHTIPIWAYLVQKHLATLSQIPKPDPQQCDSLLSGSYKNSKNSNFPQNSRWLLGTFHKNIKK